jgi:CcmD family protein
MNGIDPNLVVAGVTFILWAGIFFYLLRLDNKIKDLNR